MNVTLRIYEWCYTTYGGTLLFSGAGPRHVRIARVWSGECGVESVPMLQAIIYDRIQTMAKHK